MRNKKLPYGVCLTYYINSSERKKKNPKKRPCFSAYYGYGKSYRSARFMIDVLGRHLALESAKIWRRDRASLDEPSWPSNRVKNANRRRTPKEIKHATHRRELVVARRIKIAA